MVLTDEQVAEGLNLARGTLDNYEGRGISGLPEIPLARLALALQERLQAAESERDHWKGRWELDTSGLKGNIERLHEEVCAREAERDEAREQRQMWVDTALRVDAAIPGKIAKARRAAFEEAAGYHDGMAQHWADLLAKLMPGTSDAEEINNARKRAMAHARNIRALAEVER